MHRLYSQQRKRTAAGEQPRSAGAAGAIAVLAQDAAQPNVLTSGDFLGGNEIAIQNVFGFSAKNVRETTGHAGPKVQSDWAQDERHAAGHILATVLANPFDHRERAAIANGKAFAGAASNEKLSGGCAVEDRVTRQNVGTAG